jgi:hypothetical protein
VDTRQPLAIPFAVSLMAVNTLLGKSEKGVCKMELSAGENLVREDSFIYSLGHFFLKTHVSLTDKRIVFNKPNLLLGLIPIGTHQETYPLRNISGISTTTKLGVFRLIIGVVLALIGASNFKAAFLLAIIGVFVILTAFQAAFSVATSGGQKSLIRVAITDKTKAQDFATRVNATVASL